MVLIIRRRHTQRGLRVNENQNEESEQEAEEGKDEGVNSMAAESCCVLSVLKIIRLLRDVLYVS